MTNKQISQELVDNLNNNVLKEIEEVKTNQPYFYAQLIKDGFVPEEHTDDKTGKLFVGWSVQKTMPRTKQIGNKIYTERTKDFYIENGRETEEHFIRAIKIRESQGDKL